MKNNIKIAIFAGGPSLEREISIKSAKNIKKNLEINFNNIIFVVVEKNLNWVINDIVVENKKEFLENIDFAINYIHGEYGEDGVLQKIIENNNIPFLGSSSKSLQNTIRKDITKKICEDNNIVTTKQIQIFKNKFDILKSEDIFKKLNTEKVIVKPADGGSSFGVSIANNAHELQNSIKTAFEVSDILVIENFIIGREFSCGVYFDVKENKNKALPVVEIKYPTKEFFDYEAKYEGLSEEICPAKIDTALSAKIKDISLETFSATSCSDFSRVDFLVDSKNNIFVVEINTIPGFTDESILPKELAQEKINISEFLKSLIDYKIANYKN